MAVCELAATDYMCCTAIIMNLSKKPKPKLESAQPMTDSTSVAWCTRTMVSCTIGQSGSNEVTRPTVFMSSSHRQQPPDSKQNKKGRASLRTDNRDKVTHARSISSQTSLHKCIKCPL